MNRPRKMPWWVKPYALVLVVAVLIAFLVTGCKAEPLSPADQFERDRMVQEIKEKYFICRLYAKQNRIVWIQNRLGASRYDHDTGWPLHWKDMRREMADNGCRVDLTKIVPK